MEEQKKRRLEEGEKVNSVAESTPPFPLRSKTSTGSTNSQITETKNKLGVYPITESNLRIQEGENRCSKAKELLKKYVNNVFENEKTLYIYCKYVMLHYGKDLVTPNEVDSLDFQMINGGITNILIKVEHTSKEGKYLIRLYGPKTDEIINREREKKISCILYDKNIAKKIYVFFSNGRIEEFMDGYALSREEIKNPKFQKLIAKNLKLLHDISLNDSLYKELQVTQNVPGTRPSFLWNTIWKYFNLLNEERKKICSFDSKANILKLIDFDVLRDSILEVEKLCKSENSPIVLCHCDLLSSNIINTKDDTITPANDGDNISFIDFEYACPMERAYDIANHFNEYAGFNCDWDLTPSKEEEYHFIKHYLGTDDDQLINNLIQEIQPFYICSHINWGLWSLLQGMHSSIDFDFINYGMTRLTASCLPIFRSKVSRKAEQ
ncbi:ethanolamine kinase [Plasmodium cynomolgi strain B]|uniref:ethanolamine kinase n=1 Tax=Plasmodium cynomolgi (strain B) TaxID=1120755 RepID=K6UDF7_PLACD|nr:ethanolamine kinase [Plasmodium cynomolgi strain B]GAB66521.1 ethanolamine kinase [Plasmodium cynomolgi strain B]